MLRKNFTTKLRVTLKVVAQIEVVQRVNRDGAIIDLFRLVGLFSVDIYRNDSKYIVQR